jgi:ssDNA-binding replication factor A large subunit
LAQATLDSHSISRLTKLPAEYSNLLDVDEKENESGASSQSEIGKMRFGQDGLSFKAHVVKKSEVRAVTTRDGTPLTVCSITLSDGTGQIPLAVWNSQISTVSEGDLVEVQNARVRSFRGERQLALSRKTGVLTVLQTTSKGRQTITA